MSTQPLVKQAEGFDACTNMIDRSINPIFRLTVVEIVLNPRKQSGYS